MYSDLILVLTIVNVESWLGRNVENLSVAWMVFKAYFVINFFIEILENFDGRFHCRKLY